MLIRPGNDFLLSNLRQLTNPPHVSYIHLDWVPTKERLQDEFTFALEEDGRLGAIINLSPETKNFAWLRFFFSTQDGKHQDHFEKLLSFGKKRLNNNKEYMLYSLSHHNWFENMLSKNGFTKTSQIVTLTTSIPILPPREYDPKLIKTITVEDIPLIFDLDAQCFSDPWQLNELSLHYCIGGADLATYIKCEGQVLAYQVSHVLFDHIHIARLAVHPQHRRKGYATILLTDLIERFKTIGNYVFSINTQEDNHASIALYKKFGFRSNQESFPVYKLETS